MRERLLFVLLQINRQIIIRPGSFKAFQQDQSSVTFMRTDPSCSTLSQIRRPEQTHGNWGSFVSPIICRPIRAQECGQIIVQRFNYPGTFWDILARCSLNVLFWILRSDLAYPWVFKSSLREFLSFMSDSFRFYWKTFVWLHVRIIRWAPPTLFHRTMYISLWISICTSLCLNKHFLMQPCLTLQ